MKMCDELPVCKRCCFCLPLRYGLITWGYIKLITLTFFITVTCSRLLYTIWLRKNRPQINRSEIDYGIAVISIVLILLVSDWVLTTLLIVGGHKKNVKLLRVFSLYSKVALVMTTLLTAMIVGELIVWWFTLTLSIHSWMRNVMDLSFYFTYIAVQIYFLLLVRSEIIKLNNNCEFRFVNNAMEAQCTMKADDDIADEDKETKNV